ncbi:FecCD family ABC transporter permease [Agaribacterium sp. ZY112]|uniref:FecCD family ABC transporter permease n=1 Tax=Agaribacterium sp. ZY112 TaxID=3233574 RepID=UPI0035266864
MPRPSPTRLISILIVLILLAFFASLSLGASQLSWPALLRGDALAETIFWQLRLPRSLLAIAVGCMLAMSGCAMQGLFRNALADPSLIGVNAGASLGASLSIFFSASLSTLGLIGSTAIGACLGASIAIFAIYRIAKHDNYINVTTMLLAGMALSALAAGLNQLLQFFSSDQVLRQMSLWHMGKLSGANWLSANIAIAVAIFSSVIIFTQANVLNAFLLGESEARHLGFNVERKKNLLIIIVAIACGTSLALCGSIIFIGLIVPHLCRLLVGPGHRLLLPVSAIIGALLMLTADTLARLAMQPSELPVGLLIAFIGAPFFLLLLRRQPSYGY